jgi:asparagine synthase (glutamine-hydrolysing)
MGVQRFGTHQRSILENGPQIDAEGNIVAFDGRLDNHREVGVSVEAESEYLADSRLVLMLFQKLGEGCFARLVGDWAAAIWSAKERALYLARDHAGSRTLFFRHKDGATVFSSYLETFLTGDNQPGINEEFISRTLAGQDIQELTPLRDVSAVPPSHYVSVRNGRVETVAHWNWVADSEVEYRSDSEYDEHFLYLFRQAVERRIGPGAPIVAELSGGMDSSAIVCIADEIARRDGSNAQVVGTLSYFDNSEPDWNERPYFEAVEAQRGKAGIHIDCSSLGRDYVPPVLTDRSFPYPGYDRASFKHASQLHEHLEEGRFRVVLSGLGGDELLGGLPTPVPELADYLRAGKIRRFVSEAARWCTVSREPLAQMLFRTVRFTVALYREARINPKSIPPWLSEEVRETCVRRRGVRGNLRSLLNARPSAISSGRTWFSLLETLRHLAPPLAGCCEFRYPYLDRDLVDYLHRVPRAKLVQPTRRRTLMRRALKGIVPDVILERNRKAYVSRGPLLSLRDSREQIDQMFLKSLLAEYGFIDEAKLLATFHEELDGDLRWISQIHSAIGTELWLLSSKQSIYGPKLWPTKHEVSFA